MVPQHVRGNSDIELVWPGAKENTLDEEEVEKYTDNDKILKLLIFLFTLEKWDIPSKQ